MSDYESHSGKLRLVKATENETFEQLERRIWNEEGNNDEGFKNGKLFEEYYNQYINDDDLRIWEVFDHEDEGDEDTFCRIHKNEDGTYSFHTRFYNGGTCLSEMIEESINEIANP